MFCHQCEQTAQGKACTQVGVCGKQPDTAAMQDLLVFVLKGLSMAAVEADFNNIDIKEVNNFVAKALFATLTNVDFDTKDLAEMVRECVRIRQDLIPQITKSGGRDRFRTAEAAYMPAATIEEMVADGEKLGAVKCDPELMDPDVHSMRELLLYAIKGMASYAYHATTLGFYNHHVASFINQGLSSLINTGLTLHAMVKLIQRCGEINLLAMETLDKAHTETYGHPVPTQVPLGAKQGKAILVSGHDLKDLAELLQQTAGKGINVYTHGEMLPAHGYPELKKHPHFYGHYGTAWQNQHTEFADFPGAILMTTNCLMPPKDAYKDKLFTIGPVAFSGLQHLGNSDFAPVINKALELPGFSADAEGKSVTTGFGHNAVIGIADKIVEAIKNKKIRHFFLVGGCDGAKPGRSYYTEFVEKVPEDCVVLTLACGKFRFFDKDLGDIDGIPRLIDIGQCNDAYSAIKIAEALAITFDCPINDLPLSFILSWYEQKAVAILLTLFACGINDIRLGPSLPAFITPNVLQTLVENFNVMPITTPDEDLKAILD